MTEYYCKTCNSILIHKINQNIMKGITITRCGLCNEIIDISEKEKKE